DSLADIGALAAHRSRDGRFMVAGGDPPERDIAPRRACRRAFDARLLAVGASRGVGVALVDRRNERRLWAAPPQESGRERAVTWPRRAGRGLSGICGLYDAESLCRMDDPLCVELDDGGCLPRFRERNIHGSPWVPLC